MPKTGPRQPKIGPRRPRISPTGLSRGAFGGNPGALWLIGGSIKVQPWVSQGYGREHSEPTLDHSGLSGEALGGNPGSLRATEAED